MQISRIDISNFKRISSVSVEISDVTFLVGGNNSGKSSVLQAIHMAVSCAQRSLELQQQVIAESSLLYCPTGDFQELGNSAPYENRRDGSRGTVEFSGKTGDGASASYKIEIYKARNHHNVGVDRSGVYPSFGQYICDASSLFSVYVPGLAGIPHNEDMQNYASVFRRAAGGEANLVFRNIIRLISDRGLLEGLEGMLYDILGPCKFKVKFDPDRDLYVDVKLSLEEGHYDDTFVPIDLSGTGVIQITQILAYVILFRPKLLLVDEPDSHLHPSRQSLLSTAFEKIVSAYGCKIIVSTHSRHLVNSAPAGTRFVWLRNGNIEAQSDDKSGLAAILLDLGALDQLDSSGADIIICTEDKGARQLELCLSQINIGKRIKILSYNGVNNAASAVVIKEMSGLFVSKPKIVIHRDRDFLLDNEIEAWGKDYTNRNMHVFCPRLPDVESYFVTEEHVASIYSLSLQEAGEVLNTLREAMTQELRKKFKDKRRQAIATYWKDGGGPPTDALWPDDQPVTDERALGKLLVSRINEEFSRIYGGRRNLFGKASVKLVVEMESFLSGVG